MWTLTLKLLLTLCTVGAMLPAHAGDGVAMVEVDDRYAIASPVEHDRVVLYPQVVIHMSAHH